MEGNRTLRSLAKGAALFSLVAAGFLTLGYVEAAAPDQSAFALATERLRQLPATRVPSEYSVAVLNYERPAWHRRLSLYEKSGRLIDTFLVAHGRGSGDFVDARNFSNEVGSNQSSLGLFRVLGAYEGAHGVSLRLQGLDAGVNDAAARRSIVIHGADYVSLEALAANILRGRGPGIGRSLGCPAVSVGAIPVLVEALGGHGFLYVVGSQSQ